MKFFDHFKKIFFTSLSVLTGAFLLIALLSYNQNDPCLFYDISDECSVNNLAGRLGANVAAILLYLFGSASIFLVVIFAILAVIAFGITSFKNEWDRIVGLMGLVFSGAILSKLVGLEFFRSISPGGFIGFFVTKNLELKDPIYTYLLVYSVLTCSLVLIFRFSWIKLLKINMGFLKAIGVQDYLDKITNNIKDTYVYGWDYSYLFWNKFYLKTNHDTSKIAANIKDILLAQNANNVNNESNKELNNKINSNIIKNSNFLDNTGQNFIDSMGNLDSENINDTGNIIKNINNNFGFDTVSIKDNNFLDLEKKDYVLPDSSLLDIPSQNLSNLVAIERESEKRANILQEKLECFGINGKIKAVTVGPVVTLFEYQPSLDTKISHILAREDDLALALQAVSLRIIAPIPGKSVVGFEVANFTRKPVLFAQGAQSDEFNKFRGKLPILLGKSTKGSDIVIDLASTPHLLVAGSTGSGKSVALNTMLISLLFKLKPDELKLILIDPKRLEFASYVDIPHLMFPVISDVQEAISALHFVVTLMDERYKKMANQGVRNIDEYNNLVSEKNDSDLEINSMPYLVVVIDELADLMIKAGRDVEHLIVRISQMARAAGIHMIVATQRPSVDVVTGLIKVNFTSRVAFKVTSKIDSRTILDCSGADKLLGKGDMLFLDMQGNLNRLHGFYTSNKEIVSIIEYIKSQQEPDYSHLEPQLQQIGSVEKSAQDEILLTQAINFIKTRDEISISLLQRQFKIGYNKSARIMEMLESQGHIAQQTTGKMRKVIH